MFETTYKTELDEFTQRSCVASANKCDCKWRNAMAASNESSARELFKRSQDKRTVTHPAVYIPLVAALTGGGTISTVLSSSMWPWMTACTTVLCMYVGTMIAFIKDTRKKQRMLCNKYFTLRKHLCDVQYGYAPHIHIQEKEALDRNEVWCV